MDSYLYLLQFMGPLYHFWQYKRVLKILFNMESDLNALFRILLGDKVFFTYPLLKAYASAVQINSTVLYPDELTSFRYQNFCLKSHN